MGRYIYGESTISIYSSHVKMIHPTAEIVWFVHARYGKHVHDMTIGFSSAYDKWICQQILSVLPAKWGLMFEYTYYLSSFFTVFACPSVELFMWDHPHLASHCEVFDAFGLTMAPWLTLDSPTNWMAHGFKLANCEICEIGLPPNHSLDVHRFSMK